MDAIYTPPELAEFLASTSSLTSPCSIADFAAGDGALLRAAAQRWPQARLFGSDIDEIAVLAVRNGVPKCDARGHDFLAENGDGSLEGRSFDLILLNPPFSCRGNTRYLAEVADVTYSASKALAFVARALKFLTTGGEVVAILPASVLVSERDEELLAAMRAWGSVEQIGEVREAAFKSHAVAVTILRIAKIEQKSDSSPKHSRLAREKLQLISLRPYVVEMSRGSLSVHDYIATKTGPRFIHTTQMRDGRISSAKQRVSPNQRRIKGPAVLVPRVGRPSKEKVVLLPNYEAVLSDCVIALRTTPAGNERALAKVLTENWDTFKLAYGGSCASYTTLKRMGETLLRLGISSSVRLNECDRQEVRSIEEKKPFAASSNHKQLFG